jgi:hypothetical protein
MGYYTHYYGKLEFTRRLTLEELATLERIINVGREHGDVIGEAAKAQAEAIRAIDRDGKGPLVFDPYAIANLCAAFSNLITGEALNPHDASSLRITDDGMGLRYCSEKTYDMIGGLNFIIANARREVYTLTRNSNPIRGW